MGRQTHDRIKRLLCIFTVVFVVLIVASASVYAAPVKGKKVVYTKKIYTGGGSGGASGGATGAGGWGGSGGASGGATGAGGWGGSGGASGGATGAG